MTKPTKPRDGNQFEKLFNHKDIVTVTNFLIHNKDINVTEADIEKHYGFSDFYLKKNILKHLQDFKIIKKSGDNYSINEKSHSGKALISLYKELMEVNIDG